MTPTPLHILMVAAENDALPGAKVGGIGDVVRDLPPALAVLGCTVTVVLPGYGFLAHRPGAHTLTRLPVGFGGTRTEVELFEVPARHAQAGVRHIVIEHPAFAHGGRIYCDDPPDRPFATDAGKYALLCAAVAEATVNGQFGHVDVLHLHDWHAAFLTILRRFHPGFAPLRALRCVVTLHNLALQGVRPLRGHASSLEAWYPGLPWEPWAVLDPRWLDCVNPMAAAIRLADAVHAVSPSYAQEILLPSDVAGAGRYGGEGLEVDLQRARDEGRLWGILNGCEYPAPMPPPPEWPALLKLARGEVLRWAGAAGGPAVASAHFLAHARLGDWLDRPRPATLLTSVGRMTDQKAALLLERSSDGRSALDAMLDALGPDGAWISLGSGDPAYERALVAASARHPNFVFLQGYSEPLSSALYAAGDLFVMPSSFEPCGISQMLAMRAGQPCLVHAVGGLRDTVEDGVTGFAFAGDGRSAQADALVLALYRALDARREPGRWQAMSTAAREARFLWEDSARACLVHLYHAG